MTHPHLINYPLPSTTYYEARLGSLWRNLGRVGRPAEIVTEHLDRALRSRGYDPSLTFPTPIPTGPTVEGGKYWMNGILAGVQR